MRGELVAIRGGVDPCEGDGGRRGRGGRDGGYCREFIWGREGGREEGREGGRKRGRESGRKGGKKEERGIEGG